MKKFLRLPHFYLSLQSQTRKGAVAQMVEQWTENPCVGSSILPSTTVTRSDRAGFIFWSHFWSHFFPSRRYFLVPFNALFDTQYFSFLGNDIPDYTKNLIKH